MSGTEALASVSLIFFHPRRYFETVEILQKAGVDLAQLDRRKGSAARQSGETAIDIDKIPQVRRKMLREQKGRDRQDWEGEMLLRQK